MKILISESQFDSLKKNNIEQSIDEDISAGSVIVYHRTRMSEENIKSLNSGFIPGDGQLYGRGLYSTYDFNSQLSPNMTHYGNIVVEFSITKFDKILVLNSDECKKIYGKVISVDEQMKKILKGDYKKYIKNVPDKLKNYIPDTGVNGPIANEISNIKNFQLEFDGLVFIGGNDGKVLVLFETNLANPLRYTTDDGKSWKSIKTKESFNIGKDKRGYGKFINYLNFKRGSSFDFQSFSKKNKYEIITQKIKNKIPLGSMSEYEFYIENFKPSDEEKYDIIYHMLSVNSSFLNEFDVEDKKIQLMAVKIDPFNLSFYLNLDVELPKQVQLVAVQQNGKAIQYIPNPSEQVQLVAVQQNGYAIQYIVDKGITPSEQVQLIAVQQNGYAINYIPNPSEQVQLMAVEKNGSAISFIKNPSEQVQLTAVQQDGQNIRYIIEKGITPSEQVQLAAVQQNPQMLRMIIGNGIKPSDEVYRVTELSWEKKLSINEDVFRYDDLTDEEKNKTYEIFRDSYQNATGNSWDKMKFSSRASNWTFYGVKDKGFIVVRKQKSGMNKLTGVAGDLKSISIGIEELNKLEEPTWGMADKKIVNVLTGRYNFISPPAFVVKMLIKFIPNEVFGGVQYVINKDGSLTFNYSDVGDATKYFFGNKKYFQSLLKNVSMNSIVKFAIQKLIS